MKVAIIGGGAAGFFAALAAKNNDTSAEVVIFEKSPKLLSKVKVSGGGRCNVTNGTTSIKELTKAYPRGSGMLKKAFHIFSTKDTMTWFESRGVPLMIQEDQCVFPVSQDSQSIIDCFMQEARLLGIQIHTNHGVVGIEKKGKQLVITFSKDAIVDQIFDKIIVATGGSPRKKGLEWLEKMGHTIEEPVPSLFTFNMPDESVKSLMGIVVEPALVSIVGTKLKAEGPLLITHWGMSGPAVLKLSAFGARLLKEKQYQCTIQVNWVNEPNQNRITDVLNAIVHDHPKKQLGNFRPYKLPERLWHFLLNKRAVPLDKTWGELGKKGVNKLLNILANDTYQVNGKTTFKEEFVTCGGVSLEDIDHKTMQSKKVKNLYFAGEVLDVDGITGGYNFQAAWTTGFIAAKLEE